ncbi:hypothetical protein [Cardinium endosymbiont of Culicoides punctatus]|uniref:hypothetical protein n=1 Tax=Cardinium endosymbiont of Culicoides punctatus TaxID=2304601 RepID=UPI0010F2A505|nr:hypothetical protein [Cardinium endosymbiont of Culicoides punctatus]TDG94986.1 hypothetical protein CCPUN_06420 [Cardinium endosymbiont of Culicoides punctatus]
MNFNSEEKEVYEDHLKWIRTEALAVKTAEEKGEKIGLEKGREKGREEGIEEGERIGLEKGKKEERYATALKMLELGINIDTISIVTTFSRKEIISIMEENNLSL